MTQSRGRAPPRSASLIFTKQAQARDDQAARRTQGAYRVMTTYRNRTLFDSYLLIIVGDNKPESAQRGGHSNLPSTHPLSFPILAAMTPDV